MVGMYSEHVRNALPGLRDRIARAAERSGRDGDAVRLIAVTKAHPIEAVHAAIENGLKDLGENRPEELEWKVQALGPTDVCWHMIGHVQRRKVPRLVGCADLVHSVDSVRLAERFDRVGEEAERTFDVLIQVNVSGEDTKSGFTRTTAPEGVREILELPRVRVKGLMTMAPFVHDECVLRDTFRSLRELHEVLGQDGRYEGSELSMGMTNDFEIAIEEGSTMIRLGTALFGPRKRM
jgi:pyridoxal phosphate enzyme (YggS family)